MSRQGSTGVIRVAWAPDIADITAPTVAEAETAAVVFTGYLTRSGLSTPRQGSTIDTSDAGSRQNKSAPGTKGGEQLTLTLHRDSDVDLAWQTFVEDAEGFLVVRRFGGSDVAFAAADVVEVYPVAVISRAMADIGDQSQQFTATVAVTDEAEQDAVVAV